MMVDLPLEPRCQDTPFDDTSNECGIDTTNPHDVLDEFGVDELQAPRWPLLPDESRLGIVPGAEDLLYSAPPPLFDGSSPPEFSGPNPPVPPPVALTLPPCKMEDIAMSCYNTGLSLSVTSATTSASEACVLAPYMKTPQRREAIDSDCEGEREKKRVQKPPTTAGITLDNLKAVFALERPEAEKRLGLKRTTFSNLSRYYGISKWPFRTIRDATNRKKANERLLRDPGLSKEKRRKLQRQQVILQGVINLMYSDPTQSKDSNTLAVLMNIVASRDDHSSSKLDNI